MIAFLGAFLLLWALRDAVLHFARFRPHAEDDPPESPPQDPIPLPDLPHPGRIGLLVLAGVGALFLLELTWAGAWCLVLAAGALASRLGAPASPKDASPAGEGAPAEEPDPLEARAHERAEQRRTMPIRRARLRLDVFWGYATLFLLPCFVLLVRARTWEGHAFSLACLLGACALAWLIALRRKLALLSLGLACGLLLALLLNVPQADPGRVESRVLSGPKPAAWVPSSLVPEEDQFQLATFLLPLIDPLVDWEQSRRVRRVFGQVYDGVEADPDLHRLPGIMGATYRDMLGLPLPAHHYVYVPEGPSPKAGRPTIVFLHGSLGSFQGYLVPLKALADAEGYALVAVSFGSGLWGRKGGVERIEAALRFCREDPRLDGTRLVLVGISAGGRGLALAGAAFPDQVRGLAFVSPNLEASLFAEKWSGRPVFVVHGETDRRIPLTYVQRKVALLEGAGAKVEFVQVPNEDHFLWFSDPERVNRPLAKWLRGVLAP